MFQFVVGARVGGGVLRLRRVVPELVEQRLRVAAQQVDDERQHQHAGAAADGEARFGNAALVLDVIALAFALPLHDGTPKGASWSCPRAASGGFP